MRGPVRAVGVDGSDSRHSWTGNRVYRRGDCEMATRTRWTKAGALVAAMGWTLAVSTAAGGAHVAHWRFGNHDAGFFGTLANSHWSADVPAARIYDPLLSGYVANSLSMALGPNSMIQ